MARQYVAVAFRPGDRRTYTYHWEGGPLSVGVEVKVPDRSGDGWQRVTVAEVDVAKPTGFDTKAILGLAPAETALVEEAALPVVEAPRIGAGAIVEGFRWRTREGDRVAPADMETRHLFYSLRMIWNNHVPDAERVGRNVKLYAFPSFYTAAYFEEAITNLAAALFRRPDLAPWQRAELQEMAGHTARRVPDQLALEGGR